MRYVLIVLAALCMFSCNEAKEIEPTSLGYDFYPIAIGQYRIYEVEEIEYKLIGFDTSYYQLRETIFDSLLSGDQTKYLIRRDKRDTALEDWETDSVWSVTQTSNYLSVTENNVPFMKLTFPVQLGREWNGNSLNTRFETTYYYEELFEALIDTITVADHIRLIIEDVAQNIVSQDERSEVYARGIGLVQKDYLTLQFCTVNCGELGEIQGGRFLSQVLVEAGNE